MTNATLCSVRQHSNKSSMGNVVASAQSSALDVGLKTNQAMLDNMTPEQKAALANQAQQNMAMLNPQQQQMINNQGQQMMAAAGQQQQQQQFGMGVGQPTPNTIGDGNAQGTL